MPPKIQPINFDMRFLVPVLPFVFVGKANRLCQIVTIEVAKQSLKKKGMHFPPWRKVKYMKAKWLSPYTRATPSSKSNTVADNGDEPDAIVKAKTDDDCVGDLGLIFGEAEVASSNEEKTEYLWWLTVFVAKPRSIERAAGGKVAIGLASLLKDKP